MQSGIFIVDKPANITSNQLVQKIKKQFNYHKVGHAGTLDPLATGVMIVLVNQGTKFSDLLLNEDKKYFVTVKLYQATDSFDADGEIIASTNDFHVTETQVIEVLKKYDGYSYNQTPPIYSAIKINGKKLYEYARNGINVKIKPRKVEIYATKFRNFDVENHEFSFEVHVSKGTYIRSLVVDLTNDLNTIGHIKALQRTSSGPFDLTQAIKLTELEETKLLPLIEVVNQLPITKYELSEELVKKVNYGQKITLPVESNQVFLTYKNQVIALYEKVADNLFVSLKNGFN